jgi:hypothetical protein
MHWRYFKATLIGGLLASTGFVVADLVTGAWCGHWWDGGLDRVIAQHVPMRKLQPQARQLVYQSIFLRWLLQRGELAGRITAIGALLGASAVLARDQIRQTKNT